MTSNSIATILQHTHLGDPVAIHNLVMFPLMSDSAPALEYLTLDEALSLGSIEITEVSGHGSVPELHVKNRSPKPTLILDGEELLGAKQNRVVNLTILVPAETELTIPVSCVEAGRWRSKSRSFTAAPRAQYATGRAKRMAQVSRSMVDRGTRTSDQAEVWADIAEMSSRLSAVSPTAAMEQIFVDHAPRVESYVAGCVPAEGQCGAAFAIDERIIGFDLFDSAATFRNLLPKLVRSYAIDAIDGALGDQAKLAGLSGPRLVASYLAAVAAAPQQQSKAIGLGDDVRVSGNGLVAAALVAGGRVVHLSGFTS